MLFSKTLHTISCRRVHYSKRREMILLHRKLTHTPGLNRSPVKWAQVALILPTIFSLIFKTKRNSTIFQFFRKTHTTTFLFKIWSIWECTKSRDLKENCNSGNRIFFKFIVNLWNFLMMILLFC